MSQHQYNLSDKDDANPAAPGQPLPPNVMGMIADLLEQQQQWQQRQSDSEQLIAKMAEQLESSRKSIESLSGVLNNGQHPGVSPAPGLPKTSIDLDTPRTNGKSENGKKDGCGLSWESQKKLLMAGYNSENPSVTQNADDAATPEPIVETSSDPDSLEIHEAAATRESTPFLMVHEHELAALGDCDKSEMLRKLRRKLEDKLRDAEIEISIERAKIHRARRELQELRTEFEREVIRVRDEYSTGKNKKNGHSRWTRFLGESTASTRTLRLDDHLSTLRILALS